MNRPTAWVIGVVVLLFAISILRPSPPPEYGPPRLSSFTPGPLGGEALWRTFGAVGLDARRWYRPPLEYGRGAPNGVLVMLAPTRDLSGTEVEALLDWVRMGGDLVVTFVEALENETLMLVPRSRLNERLDEVLSGASVPTGEYGLLHTLGDGRVLRFRGARRVASGRIGEGNAGVDFVLEVARLAAGRPIMFDESAHGHGDRVDVSARMAAFMTGTNSGRALLGGLILAALALLAAGARRGPPLSPFRLASGGRSSLEQAESLALAWRAARAVRRPTRVLLDDLAERLRTRDLVGWCRRRLEQERDPETMAALERVLAARQLGRTRDVPELLALSRAIRHLS